MFVKIKPHHARFGMAIASLVGLFASAYLFYTYVTGAPIACGIVSGCDVVRASKWANTFFNIPRPFLGLVFYAAVFGLLVARAAITWRPRLLHRLTILAAAIGFIESGFLFLVQWLDLKAFCLWCLTSAIAAFAIAGLAFFDRDEEPRAISGTRELRRYFIALLIYLPMAFFGFIFLTRYAKHAPAITTIGPAATAASSTNPFDAATILLHSGVPVEGPVLAKVLVVEFGDFQCPACGAFQPTMKKIREDFRGRIRFAFRNMPLTDLHEHAMDAAIAGECANKQGKFFAYADILYANQDKLTEADLKNDAKQLGLDEAKFASCYADPATKKYVEQDQQEAIALGVQVTPTLFVNRTKIDQALPYDEMKALIEKELAN